ncbi:hypothetical protein JAAARDRAFT_121787 [Jaapia argillacea MUCL 33604]|uniref:Arrestin-like N-terminal domain-containing protein n=1 Tax=Jaapia argillacea MUCL 33604 TaxID=933084 RepID=A0A067Q6G0_9AGAM|nr:hypothetical protein JAAARDRAFT_121787 [Jaapia argillacea MUCL 33604]
MSLPPSYYPSSDAPCYSSEPSPDEQRLEFTGRSRRPLPSGAFHKQSKKFTMVLKEQETGARLPSYGRNGALNGEIHLHCPTDNVAAVEVKLEGRLALTIAEGGSQTTTILSNSHTLWRDEPTYSSCPSVIPFNITFPPSCTVRDRTFTSPPSYNAAFPGVPGLYAKCAYTVTVLITEYRSLGFFKRRKISHLGTHMNYLPRTRPCQPILPSSLSFRSTVKTSPEEWFQVISQMDARSNSGFAPIDCHLFIPAVQIYAISDTIPFFLQLRAPKESLQAFMCPTPSEKITPKMRAVGKPTVRVFLFRQVTAEVRKQKAWRICVIGEGELRPLPPEESAHSPYQLADECLDWEGEVKCDESVTVGGFKIGPLVVKDFIVLSLVPPYPQSSPLVELQHAHPIRIVTDPFTEVPGPIAAAEQ